MAEMTKRHPSHVATSVEVGYLSQAESSCVKLSQAELNLVKMSYTESS